MVKIGSTWDSTTDVLSGRVGLLAPIAALAFLLPAAVQGALVAYGGTSTGVAAANSLVSLLTVVLVLWGQLAIIAVASDPATTRSQANAAAVRSLPRAVLVTVVLLAIALVAILPIAAVLLASGYDFRAAASPGGSSGAPAIPPGASLFIVFYGLLLLIAALWIGARLFLVNAVVLNERRGIGALPRSIQLTRGLTLKLIGVVLLFLIVYLVAALAVQSVFLIVLRLVLGATQIATATWLATVAGAVVGAIFNTVVAVFAARLYAAVTTSSPR